MNKQTCRNCVLGTMIFVCILQLAVAAFWCSQKNYLFFDEVFSFFSANNITGETTGFMENQWMDETWFPDFMSADAEHAFEYAIPLRNQAEDVHPPLYYLLLHTASSFIPEQFSYWSGFAVNLVCFLICSVGLYFLGKEIFQNKICGIVAAALYGLSYGGINTAVYLRMYMLLAMIGVLHAFVYAKYMEREEIPAKGYILLALTLIGGVFSQYYFLFLAFFYGVWYTIRFLVEKRYQVLVKYLATVIGSGLAYLALWPSIFEHLLGGSRGKEAQSSLLNMEGYFSDLKEMLRILSNDLFTKLLGVILLAMLVLFLGSFVKEKKIDQKLWLRAGAVVFACVGYLLIVTKVSPYMIDRYLMPIYPLVYLLVTGGTYVLLTKFIPKKIAITLCVLGFAGLSGVHMLLSGIPYTYSKNPDNLERQAVAEEYQDLYALYISDDKSCHYFDAVQMLTKYEGYYYICDLTAAERISQDMGRLETEDAVVVYVKNTKEQEQADALIGQIFPGKSLNEENLLDKDEKWSVYLLNLKAD